jgi:hypothetical protein
MGCIEGEDEISKFLGSLKKEAVFYSEALVPTSQECTFHNTYDQNVKLHRNKKLKFGTVSVSSVLYNIPDTTRTVLRDLSFSQRCWRRLFAAI